MQRNINSGLIASVSTPEDEPEASEMQALMRAEQEKLRNDSGPNRRGEPGRWEYNPVEYSAMEVEPDEPVATQPRQEVEEPRCYQCVEVQPQLVHVQPQLYKISNPDPECMPPNGERLSPPHFLGKDDHCRRRTPAEIHNKGKGYWSPLRSQQCRPRSPFRSRPQLETPSIGEHLRWG